MVSRATDLCVSDCLYHHLDGHLANAWLSTDCCRSPGRALSDVEQSSNHRPSADRSPATQVSERSSPNVIRR